VLGLGLGNIKPPSPRVKQFHGRLGRSSKPASRYSFYGMEIDNIVEAMRRVRTPNFETRNFSLHSIKFCREHFSSRRLTNRRITSDMTTASMHSLLYQHSLTLLPSNIPVILGKCVGQFSRRKMGLLECWFLWLTPPSLYNWLTGSKLVP